MNVGRTLDSPATVGLTADAGLSEVGGDRARPESEPFELTEQKIGKQGDATWPWGDS